MKSHLHKSSVENNVAKNLNPEGANRRHSSSVAAEDDQGVIKIEINKEDSILDYLTKDHKANMSLLFYDFNNANQRINTKKHPTNVADSVIPEEANEDIGNKQ